MAATKACGNITNTIGLAITCRPVSLCRPKLNHSGFDVWTVSAYPNTYSRLKSLRIQIFVHAFSTSSAMGIQGLAGRLGAYSTLCTSQQLEGYTAIVDGPGLAYQAHKLALAAAANQSRVPSYDDINNEAINWLSSLEDHGIKV